LWVDKDGAAFYWDTGLSYKSGRRVFTGINTGQLISNLPQADGVLDFVRYWGGFDANRIGLQVSGGFFHHDFLNADFEIPQFYNNGGNGYCINNEIPVHLGTVDIIPSVLFGQGRWDTGSFYWFFGKFDIPAIYGYGLSLLYEKRHLLSLRYFKATIDILSNDRKNLFTAGFDTFTGSYTLKGGGKTTGFEGTLGWLYTAGAVEGALTMSNQQYLLFPFRFFNLTGSLNTHAGYGLVRFLYRPGIFHFNIWFGAANVFLGNIEAAYDYQKKKLFGGSEAHETIGPVNLANTGIMFFLLDIGIQPYIQRFRNVSFLLGIQKAFMLPWGYEKLINAGTGGAVSPPSAPGSLPDMEMWRTILLSGLSCYLKLSW
jgi:hypothetical protein